MLNATKIYDVSGHADAISHATDALKRGELVVFPTETVYGLGADARNASAVARIFQVKGRPTSHPLIVHLAQDADLEQWACEIDERARVLAHAFWPGPLTMILKKHPSVLPAVTGGQSTVALRVPRHPIAEQLLAQFGDGIAAPSANRFGRTSATRVEHVRAIFGEHEVHLLEGGATEVGIESTIIDLSSPQAAILRAGAITRDQLAKALNMPIEANPHSAVRAPGQHAQHYAPRVGLVRVSSMQALQQEISTLRAQNMKIAALVFDDDANALDANAVVVRMPRDLRALAFELYDAFFKLETLGVERALVYLPLDDSGLDDNGLARAINDRLTRACAPLRT